MQGFFVLLYMLVCIGGAIFVLHVIWRFMKAHESIARSMSELAKKPFSNHVSSGNDDRAEIG